MRAYLDYNATTPLCAEAQAAMLAALELKGNASAVHTEGRAARALIEASRADVARLVNARARDVVFVSGGTEANNTALVPGVHGANSASCDRLLMSSIEHVSVLNGHGFAPDQVSAIAVGRNGVVDLEHLRRLLMQADAAGERALVSVMLANNETGAIQPVAAIAALAHKHGGLVHCDAIQAAGKISVDMPALGVDLMSLSAHKIGGPQGVGALIVRDGITVPPLMRGGGQELSRRAGTENLVGISGFGAAARIAAGRVSAMGQVERLRDLLEAQIKRLAPKVEIFAEAAPRLPNTSNFGLAGLTAETAIIGFDLEGVAVSSGSACSSGKVANSHVLKEMRITPDVSAGAIRVSIGYETGEAEIDRFLAAFARLAARIEASAAA